MCGRLLKGGENVSLFPLTQFDFPNVTKFDGDLRELLKYWEELMKEYDTLVNGLNQLKSDFQEIEVEFVNLEKLVYKLENTINSLLETIDRTIDEKIGLKFAEIEEYVRNEILNIYGEIQRLSSLIYTLNNSTRDYVTSEILRTESKFNVELRAINQRIDDLQFNLPQVYNITTGTKTDFTTLVYDVYDNTRDLAYNASTFDSVGLSASELDNLDKSAIEWDVNGLTILKKIGICFNPLTGNFDSVCNILQSLAEEIHKSTMLTAIEYDELELTAQEYDSKNITAYDYDFYAKVLLA